MKIYKATAGATYLVVARNMRQAIDVLWRHWEEEEQSLEETEGGGTLHLDEVKEAYARETFFQADEENERRSLWDEHLRHSEPCVLSCSEWP